MFVLKKWISTFPFLVAFSLICATVLCWGWMLLSTITLIAPVAICTIPIFSTSYIGGSLLTTRFTSSVESITYETSFRLRHAVPDGHISSSQCWLQLVGYRHEMLQYKLEICLVLLINAFEYCPCLTLVVFSIRLLYPCLNTPAYFFSVSFLWLGWG